MVTVSNLFWHEASFRRYQSSTLVGRFGTRLQNAEDVVLPHDDVLSAIWLDLAAGIFAEEDAVADFDVEGNQLAVFEPLAVAGSKHLALLRFLLRRIRDDDAVARGFLFLNPLHYDAVVQWPDVHDAFLLNLFCNLLFLIAW